MYTSFSGNDDVIWLSLYTGRKNSLESLLKTVSRLMHLTNKRNMHAFFKRLVSFRTIYFSDSSH